jgi:hypothetical protein
MFTVQREAAFGGGWIDVFKAQKEASAIHYANGLARSCGRSHLRIIQTAK